MNLEEMKKLANAEPQTMDLQEDQKIVIANPNPEILYKDTYGGIEYEFPPFLKIRVDRELGEALVLRAQEHKTMQEAAMQSDRQAWALNSDQKSEARAMLVKNYGEKQPGGELWTTHRPLRWPGLIRLPAQQAVYDEALTWREKASAEELDKYRKYYAAKLYVTKEEAEKTLASLEQSLDKAAEEKPPILSIIKLVRPDENWDATEKVKYIEDINQTPVPNQMKGREDYLNREMKKAYKAKKQTLESAKVMYEEVSLPA